MEEEDHQEELNNSFNEMTLANQTVSNIGSKSDPLVLNSTPEKNSLAPHHKLAHLTILTGNMGRTAGQKNTLTNSASSTENSPFSNHNVPSTSLISKPEQSTVKNTEVITALSNADIDSSRKRKRSAQNTVNPHVNCPAPPINPASKILNKHVTFSFQNNNNDDEASAGSNTTSADADAANNEGQPPLATQDGPSNPPTANDTANQAADTGSSSTSSPESQDNRKEEPDMEVDLEEAPPAPEDPSRTYTVIPGASDMWRLAMASRRAAARDHARICHFNTCLQKEIMPLWTYGLQQAPDWLRPLPQELTDLFHRHAREVTELTRNLLRLQLAHAERQAARHLAHTREVYNEEGNDEFPLAEARLNGIVNHYRSKERATLARRLNEDISNRPESKASWSENLPKRKVPQPSNRGERSRSRSRGRSSNRGRGRGQSRANSGSKASARSARPTPNTNRQPSSRDTSQDRPSTSGGTGRGRGSNPRKRGASQNLSPEEEAIIAALRAQKSSKQPKK